MAALRSVVALKTKERVWSDLYVSGSLTAIPCGMHRFDLQS
jgi:hypothetical protein